MPSSNSGVDYPIPPKFINHEIYELHQLNPLNDWSLFLFESNETLSSYPFSLSIQPCNQTEPNDILNYSQKITNISLPSRFYDANITSQLENTEPFGHRECFFEHWFLQFIFMDVIPFICMLPIAMLSFWMIYRFVYFVFLDFYKLNYLPLKRFYDRQDKIKALRKKGILKRKSLNGMIIKGDRDPNQSTDSDERFIRSRTNSIYW